MALDTILVSLLETLQEENEKVYKETNFKLFEHIKGRVKEEQSMLNKIEKKKLPKNTQSALIEIKDSIGIRIVTGFIGDIYDIVNFLKKKDYIEVYTEKDYVGNSKENGYRSYHLIVKYKDDRFTNIDGSNDFFVEIQLRTIAMDSWASLEHQLQYKKNKDSQSIIKELKRCSDELFSSDLKMQTIKKLIRKD